MRILYVSGTYAPGAWSGGELSAHTLLKTLKRLGLAEPLVFMDRHAGTPDERFEYEGIPIQSSEHGDRERNLALLIQEFTPDVVFTQPYWHETALKVAKQLGIVSVFRLPNVPSHIDLSISSPFAPSCIVVQTTKARAYVRDAFSREAHLLPAFIDLDRAKSRREGRRRFITMFNPILEKGGAVFRKVAEELRDRPFAFVPGWTSHRDASGRFDREIFRKSAESEGCTFDGWIPEDASFEDLDNVSRLEPRDDVVEIYDETRILLVPSQWEEQFARVIYEACANGLPVIASAVAGIAEHSRDCAILVEDFASPRAWIEEIERLDDPEIYADHARRGRDWVERNYDLEKIAVDFAAFVGRCDPAGLS
jgi:glycosyltransferase involved in cell wall biosynthesis